VNDVHKVYNEVHNDDVHEVHKDEHHDVNNDDFQ
jgi:hypothetical protein